MNIWTVFEIGINAYQAFLMIYFVRHRFHLTKPQKRYAWIAGTAVCCGLSAYLFVNIPFLDTFVFLFPLIYSCFVSDDKWYFKLFWNAVLATVFIGLTNGMINLFMLLADVSMDYIMAETSLRIVFVVSLNILLLGVIFLISRVGKNSNGALSWIPLGIFLLMLIVDLIAIETLYIVRARFILANAADYFTAISLLLLLSAVLSLALYEIMSASATRQKKIEAELQQAQLLQEHYKEIKDIYSYMASYEHDLRHQLNLVQTMVSQGKTEEAGSLYQNIPIETPLPLRFKTGNIAVDALLTVKNLTMEQVGIHFIYQLYPLQKLPILENDFCVILANILDNAIEACSQVKPSSRERAVTLKLARSWDVFFITCKNPMVPNKIRKSGSNFLSTKVGEGISGHGFGISNIRKIVDAAKGQCSFTPSSDEFVVEIVLPFNTH